MALLVQALVLNTRAQEVLENFVCSSRSRIAVSFFSFFFCGARSALWDVPALLGIKMAAAVAQNVPTPQQQKQGQGQAGNSDRSLRSVFGECNSQRNDLWRHSKEFWMTARV